MSQINPVSQAQICCIQDYVIAHGIEYRECQAMGEENGMRTLLDKLLLLALALLPLLFHMGGALSVIALLCASAVTSLVSYRPEKAGIALCGLYLLLCLWRGEFMPFLPLIAYDLASQRHGAVRFSWSAALLVQFAQGEALLVIASGLLCIAAFLLQSRTRALGEMQRRLHCMQDETKEARLLLESKNRELMEKQDYEVRLATLDERNRIAREIHDNVGHLLTRSLLQIGAMQVVHAREPSLSSELGAVKETLTDAMNSVRQSVHDLHDESIDLRRQLQELTNAFAFCPITFTFDAGELPGSLKYCFSAIVREALSNIARHSEATHATVAVIEHPALYQLVVQDNGQGSNEADPRGIGLDNMRQRVEALGGIFRAEGKKGFKIFVSVPKQEKKRMD